MIAFYNNNYNSFSLLAQLHVREEEIEYIEPNRKQCMGVKNEVFTTEDNEKCRQYVSLLTSIGAEPTYISNNRTLEINIEKEFRKGYAFIEGKRYLFLVEDTDIQVNRTENKYRRIDDSWYIYAITPK
jgi:hypothetical protein